MEKERTYLHHINHFRGIAIIFIVFWHCFSAGITHYNQNITLFAFSLLKLLPGGTTFFVFISGYLFHYIYYKKFDFKLFIIKKVKFVLFPFILISSTDILYYLSRYIISIIFDSDKSQIFLAKLNNYSFIKTYLYGHGEIPIGLWYIPFIMVVFALSPLFIKFICIRAKVQLTIICILLISSMIIHRTADNSILGIFQNVIYFTPAYLLGIFMSINFNKIYVKLKVRNLYILISAILITIFLSKIIEFYSPIFRIFDLMIFQKILLSIFFTVYLMKYKKKQIKVLNLIAENSFGIFFIHGIIIWLFNAFIFKLKITIESNSAFVYFGLSTFILIISLSITILIRKALPNKSKYIIGC